MPARRSTTDPKTVLVGVRLPIRLKRMLEAEASRQGVSLSEALRRVLEAAHWAHQLRGRR